MKAICTLVFWVSLVLSGEAQEVIQTFRGTVTDLLSGTPLSNASILVSRGDKTIAVAQTDIAGKFQIDLPVGRYKFEVSFTGYNTATQELLVNAGKEAVVNIGLTTSHETLQAIEISGTALSEDTPGLRSLSIEKTLRFPANYFDPVRVATAYPGVMATNDQNNSIIIRGNSPNGLLWKLNGLDIVNPNHQANAGTLSDKPAANGGGVNILSAQMLERTDFYLGSIPTQYGNALSGVIDMTLREGNSEHYEYTAQASLLGLDIAAEGPLGKNRQTAFIANYRYSTVGLLSAFGVNFGDEDIRFQDFSFQLNSNLKHGDFRVFGFWGNGSNEFIHKPIADWREDKDRFDIDFVSDNYAVGVNYDVKLGSGQLKTGFAYSGAEQERRAITSTELPTFQWELLADRFSQNNALLSANIRYLVPLNKSINFTAGVIANHTGNDVTSTRDFGCLSCSSRITDRYRGDVEGVLIQPYFNISTAFSGAVTVDGGLRYVNFSFNGSDAVEPRISLKLSPSHRSAFNLSYSLISQVQLPQVYGAEGNQSLGLSRSHHGDLSYTYLLGDGLQIQAGLFYQHLFDVPVEQDNTSTFSVLNLIEEPGLPFLVNDGTGKNYGIDLTVEQSFFEGHYFLLGGSYYESKYTAADGVERDTRFNGNYTVNGVYGKEWTNPDSERTIGLNTRILYLGGLPAHNIDVTGSEAQRETVLSDQNFTGRLDDYFRIDLRLSFRKNKPGYTRTLAIDIQNLFSQKNPAYLYYDLIQQKIVTKYQLGIIPILVYRIDF